MSCLRARFAPLLSVAALVLVAWAPRPALAQGQIALGQTVTGQITAASAVNAEGRRYALWTFVGTAGQAVRIDMASYALDSYLILQNAAGAELARNDDGGGRLNAQITQTLPASGVYRILAVSFRTAAGASTGEYTLSVNAAGGVAPTPSAPAQPVSPSVATPIAIGQTMTSQLTPSSPVNAEGRRYALWTFVGAAGQSVRINMASGEIDSYLILQDANGTDLARNDDGGGGLNSQITQTLPVSGTYRILALSFRTTGAMFGTYTLSVNAAGMAVVPMPPPTQPPAPVVAPPPPAQLPAGPAGGAPMRIAAGGAHSCALVGDGAVMCWGKNNWGQLGDGSTTDRATPVPLNSGFIQPGLRFVEITAGAEHTCGLTGDGRAWCWGYNFAGQLGDNSPHNRNIVRQADVIAFKHPLPVAVAGGLEFTKLAAGSNFTCGIAGGTGIAYCWGSSFSWTPVAVAGTGQFVQLAAGGGQACGATAAGAAWCWVIDATTMNGSAQAVAVAGGLIFRQLADRCGVASDGRAYCWGRRILSLASAVPLAVRGGLTFTQITAGNQHACGVASGGVAYCWGEDDQDQLGHGAGLWAPESRYEPAAIAGSARFVQVAARDNHTCGIATDGTVWCWGSNGFGQAGDGSAGNTRPSPVQVLLPR